MTGKLAAIGDVDSALIIARRIHPQISREAFEAYASAWNTAVPVMNRACDPRELFGSAVKAIFTYGADAIRALLVRGEASGEMCANCVAAVHALLDLQSTARWVLVPGEVVAEAERIIAESE